MAYQFGPFRLSPSERRLERDGASVSIGSRAFDLLAVLVENAGAVVTKKELTAKAWPDTVVDEVSLRVHISGLRKILGENDAGNPYITNVSGRGYMLAAVMQRDGNAISHEVSATAARNSLPPPLARIVGRSEAITQLANRIEAHRFVTVLGAGGMGKTTLAVSVANRLATSFPDGVVFIDLAPLNDGRLLSTTIASNLGVAVPVDTAASVICSFLNGKKLLLVLDNCEQVVDAIAALAEMIHTHCLDVCILSTSREALRADGEYIYKIEALQTPTPECSTEDSRSYPAMQLFLDRHFAAGANQELDDTELELAAEICRRLDGMALAIELTAARAASHGLARTLELLEQRFGIHWGGRRTALPRHQTLLALHDWSYNLLSLEEKALLRRIGWLSGAFTADAAAALSRGDSESVLDTLADKSLITRIIDRNAAPRYRLAETTRAYALERLQADQNEVLEVAAAHAAYFLHLMKSHAEKADSFHLTGMSRSNPDALANVRAAISWCYGDGDDPILGARLVAYASPLFLELSLLDECFRWCDLALSALPSVLSGSIAEAMLHQARAVSGIIVKDARETVTASFERALEIAKNHDNLRLRLDTMAGYNIFVMRAGDCYHGSRIADEGQSASSTSNDELANRLVLWMKGISYAYAGHVSSAREVLENGCPADYLAPLDLTLVVFTQYIRAKVQLARVLLFQGSDEQALFAAKGAIDAASQYGHPIPLCIALAYGASTAIWLEDLTSAEDMRSELSLISERHSLHGFQAVSKALAGEIRIRQGFPQEAVNMIQQAIDIMALRNHEHMLVSFHASLAEAHMALGERQKAVVEIDVAIGMAEKGGEIFQLSDLLRIRGGIRVSDPAAQAEALEDLRHACEIAKSNGNIMYELNAAAALKEALRSSEVCFPVLA
ncbi:ATP-binding protein [Rhizobium sp.]|uniref:ATP-binding protein n=1 Tax=Rhizobium sp. TaxID=391 RepID=UPI0028A81DF5